MSLQAIKLTKQNLDLIAKTTGANPESLRLLAATRDNYVLIETRTLSIRGNWRVMPEVRLRQVLRFVEPEEANRFMDVVTL